MVHLHRSVACTCAERAYRAQVAGRFDRTAPLGLPAALPDVRGWNCTHRFSARTSARQLRRRVANRITRRANTPARSHLVRNLLENRAGESTVIRNVGGAGVLAAVGIEVVASGNHTGCASVPAVMPAGRRAAPLLPELVVEFRPGVPASGQQPPLVCSRRSCGGRLRGRPSSDACWPPQCGPRRPARMLSASRRCRSTDRSGMPPRSPERPRESGDRTSAPQVGQPASKSGTPNAERLDGSASRWTRVAAPPNRARG